LEEHEIVVELNRTSLILAFAFVLVGTVSWAEDAPKKARPLGAADSFLDNEYYKIFLDMRQRFGFANRDGLDRSEAITLRTRLGIGTKPIAGFSVFAELQNIVSYCKSCYFDAVETPTGDTPIADPTNTDLNRLFLRYENEGDKPFKVIAGRQRIVYDDARFVGNVGWRQHEQTYDAGYGETNFGLEALSARYAYVWNVKRIFGDPGGNPGRADFDSKSHIATLAYDFSKNDRHAPKVEVFAYLLDLHNSVPATDGNSSNTYGFRLTGAWPFSEDWKLGYIASYAHQSDGGSNPTHYNAHYAWISADLGYTPIGFLELGFELLGSDSGDAQFRTPLATAHKFNGFADVFLDNGGATGLRDFFATVAPKLPWGIKAKFIYHKFWDDDSGNDLGNEYDAVVSKALPHGFSILGKYAYYDASQRAQNLGRQNIWRMTVDIGFKY